MSVLGVGGSPNLMYIFIQMQTYMCLHINIHVYHDKHGCLHFNGPLNYSKMHFLMIHAIPCMHLCKHVCVHVWEIFCVIFDIGQVVDKVPVETMKAT